MLTKAHSFTVNAKQRLTVLMTIADVHSSVSPSAGKTFRANAIWDTGATGTVITQEVAVACGLKPIGMTKTLTANGECDSEVFFD